MKRPSATSLVLINRGRAFNLGRIAAGPLGTSQTLAAMFALVSEAQRKEIVRKVGAALGHPRRIYDFVRRAVVYRDDPAGVELVHAPEDMLDAIARAGVVLGDCDDGSTLTAALLAAAGYEPVFIVVARRAGHFVHVLAGYVDPRSPRARGGAAQGGALQRADVVPLDPQEGFAPGQWPPGKVLRITRATGEHAV